MSRKRNECMRARILEGLKQFGLRKQFTTTLNVVKKRGPAT